MNNERKQHNSHQETQEISKSVDHAHISFSHLFLGHSSDFHPGSVHYFWVIINESYKKRNKSRKGNTTDVWKHKTLIYGLIKYSIFKFGRTKEVDVSQMQPSQCQLVERVL